MQMNVLHSLGRLIDSLTHQSHQMAQIESHRKQ